MDTGTVAESTLVERCQVCDSADLQPILFIGYLPPVNTMPLIGSRPTQQPAYPAELLSCRRCELVQLGLVVDPRILFPPSYPYTSGTTRILRENFAELYRESSGLLSLNPSDLIVDVGSNDGTLLSNFAEAGHAVQGIEPTDTGHLANKRGIRTLISFFDRSAALRVIRERGKAKLIAATNVFAHMANIHEILDSIVEMLDERGVFVTESHYWVSLIESLQYDTIYHEHLRYYSFGSLQYLFRMHGLEAFHAKRIPPHGGSIRVYAARSGDHPVRPSVAEIGALERTALSPESIERFKLGVMSSKLELYELLARIKGDGNRIYGVGAPSRASTLINYVGLDDGIIDCVLEIPGSFKIGKYIPGTVIPVVDEEKLFTDQPEYALLLSWHIADELIPKLAGRGFRGDFLVPLPTPHVVRNPVA